MTPTPNCILCNKGEEMDRIHLQKNYPVQETVGKLKQISVSTLQKLIIFNGLPIRINKYAPNAKFTSDW